jgi:SulP family sulfate permease
MPRSAATAPARAAPAQRLPRRGSADPVLRARPGSGARSWAHRTLPFLRWWPRVDQRSLRGDLVAGLTGAIIVLPQGVAFATIAGLPPEYGLYSAMIPAVVAALFGSSWHLVSGPTTAISIVVFAVVSPLAEPGSAHYVSLVLTLTFLVGAMQLAMGLARLGTLVNFVSHTVVVAFTAGAAVLIASSQLKNFLGVQVRAGASFYETLHTILLHARDIDPWVVSVGLVTLVTGLLVKRLAPRIPYMIAAMLAGSVAGIVVERFLGGAGHVRTVGALPAVLPPISFPLPTAGLVKQLAGSAFAVTMLGLTEAVSIARAIAVRSEQRIDGNQEFVGQGLANVVGSFFSSYASSGSFNRSGLNYDAGARTPLAAAFASVFLAAIVLLVAPLAAYLPIAAMAAILFLVARGLVDVRQMRSILRTSRAEAAILVVTLFSTLFLDLELAIYAGVVLSLAVYLSRTSRPPVHTLVPDAEGRLARSDGLAECAQLRIVEVHGSLFFGAIDHVEQQLEALDAQGPRQKHVLLVADGINFADMPGAEMLVREARRRRRAGGGLYLVGLKERTLDALRAGGHLEEIGEENVFDGVARAIEEIRARLDPAVCQGCAERVFVDCAPAAPDRARRAATGIEAAMTAAAFAEAGEADAARRIMADGTDRPAERTRRGARRGPAAP